MLYILTGTNVMKAKARAMMLAKGSEIVRFGEGGELFASVPAYLSAHGLFVSKVALILDRPLEDTDGKALLTERAKELAEAGALVIVIEPVFDAATKKKIASHGTVEIFEDDEKDETPLPSVFALTDAVAAGDRKGSWILYRRLIVAGVAPEEIHGALAWQARALSLAAKTKSAVEAGLKPFVFSKAKRASERMGVAKAEELSREMVRLVHESRLGGGDLGELIEAFLLKK